MTDFKWRHFQGDVILWAVRWYCRYPRHCCKVSDEAAFC
ncbi:TPA: IS6 family transposase, partial [Pseudomonas aeruginosa]|nr:IS6 family transposase [Pseudomonas aeruginosa]